MTLCTEVQELVSAAYDGEVTDADAIAAAKAHCAGCAECAAFVTFLGTVRRIEPQPAPEEAIARVLETVRSEMAADAARTAATPTEAEQTAVPVAAEPAPTVPAVAVVDASAEVSHPDVAPVAGAATPAAAGELRRPDWRVWRPWMAAAAVVLVGAVLIGAQGVRYIMSPSTPSVAPMEASSLDTVTGDDAATELRGLGADDAVPAEDGETAPDTSYRPQTSEAGAYVAFNGSAYRLTGEGAEPDVPPSGSVTSALDSGGAPRARDTWTGTTPATLVVAAEEGRYLTFARVERTLGGRVFALAADRVDSFASVVGLPGGIPRPTAPDGSPTFVSTGVDDAETEVFVRPGADPRDGFAIAPGAESTEWTWWTPVQ